MRTVRSVSRLGGGVYFPRGCASWGCVLPGGCASQGDVCFLGGASQGVCFPGCASGGCASQGGVHFPGGVPGPGGLQVLPPLWTDRHV